MIQGFTDQIVLQFAAESSIGSRLICFGTQAEYSHVDTVLPNGGLLGARLKGGVRIRRPGYAKFTRTLQVTISTEPEKAKVFYSFLNEQIGKPYDWRAVVDFAFDRNWRNPDAWFCDDLPAVGLEESKIINHLAVEPWAIAPKGLLLIASAIGEITEIK